MIKLVIFDLSNVCYSLEEPQFIEDFAEKHSIDHQELDELYQSLLVRAEVNEFSGTEVWRRVLAHFKIDADVDEIIKEMIAMKEEKPETLAFAKQLRSKIKTSFFTNYNEDYWKIIEEKLKPEQWFDWGLVSYQAKTRKPAGDGFKVILEHFGVKPEEAVFTDDDEYRMENAAKLGINTIHFESVEKLKEGLAKLGVAVD